jgi:hypothetical protein
MTDIKPISENRHKELLGVLMPLIDFMDKNGYSYFLVAGKDGVCSRYMRGNFNDVTGMLTGMAENNKEVKVILEHSLNEIDP